MKKKEKNYKESLVEIEEIVSYLENGEADIDEIIEKVKRASELIKVCKQKLRVAEEDLDNILNGDNE